MNLCLSIFFAKFVTESKRMVQDLNIYDKEISYGTILRQVYKV